MQSVWCACLLAVSALRGRVWLLCVQPPEHGGGAVCGRAELQPAPWPVWPSAGRQLLSCPLCFSSRFVSSTAELRASSASLCGPHRLTQGLVPIGLRPFPSPPTLEAVVFRISKEGHQSVAGPCCLSVVLVPLCICCGPWTSNLTPLSQDSFLCETDVLMPLPWCLGRVLL